MQALAASGDEAADRRIRREWLQQLDSSLSDGKERDPDFLIFDSFGRRHFEAKAVPVKN